MKEYCENEAEKEVVERWIAEGFWYIQWFTKDWTTHPNFPQPYSKEYYQKAYQLLDDLADYFFMGESPYLEGVEIELL